MRSDNGSTMLPGGGPNGGRGAPPVVREFELRALFGAMHQSSSPTLTDSASFHPSIRTPRVGHANTVPTRCRVCVGDLSVEEKATRTRSRRVKARRASTPAAQEPAPARDLLSRSGDPVL